MGHEAPTRQRWIRGLAALLIAAPLVCAALWLALPTIRQGEARAALGRWRAAPVPHYQLRVEESAMRYLYLQGRCAQEVEVRGEAVVDVSSDGCPTAWWTVSTLFRAVLEPGQPGCESARCVCRLVPEVRAEFDERLGYPRRVTLRYFAQPNWTSPEYWESAWELRAAPDCSSATSALDRTLVVSLTPLP